MNKLDFTNNTKSQVEESLFTDILTNLTNRLVELIIVDDKEIREINKTHRSKDSTTDVLSFPFNGDFEQFPLGSIIISLDTAKKQAQEVNNSLEIELQILFLHGMLHILGFDHEKDSGEMAEKEEEYRIKFNLPVGLIKRNDK